MKRAIEEDFQIVEINRLAAPERNAFKPIYQMHKWFARRASCVFRAILLGALKPAGTNIMKEFYKDHSNDPDTNGKVVLDPLMGGGTTVVEALRLGCKVVGIDLNPVAWLIVKTEVEPVDLKKLDEAFERLAKPGALKDIRLMVEQIVSSKTPLPSELENVDALTQVWLLAELYKKREVSVDSISKDTRGVFEVSDLTGHKPPLLRKGRIKGGRTYEVLTPSERLEGLRQTLRGAESNALQLALLAADDNTPIAFGPELVDVIHLLAGNAEQGERLDHLVERFRGQREQIRAALQYLKQRDPDRWVKACDKLLPFYDDLFATAVANKGLWIMDFG